MENAPTITFGQYVTGFAEWYKGAYAMLRDIFANLSDDTREEFDSLEDFALEVYHETKA